MSIEEQIRDMLAQGMLDAEIGKKLGMTPNGVGYQRRRMGLPPNGPVQTYNAWSKEEDKVLLSMWDEGATAPAIGKVLDRKAGSVRNRRLRLIKRGTVVKQVRKRWTDEDDKHLLQLVAKGKPYIEIAEILGRGSVAAVKNRLQMLGEQEGRYPETPVHILRKREKEAAAYRASLQRAENQMRYDQWAQAQRRNDNWQPGQPAWN